MHEVAGTELLTTEEVAEICRTSTKTVQNWAYQKIGPPSFRLGKRRVYDRQEFEAWLAQRKAS